MWRRVLLPILLLVPMLGAGGYLAGWWKPSPAWDPLAPLDIRAEPNPVTRLKILRLNARPSLCQAALDASEVRLVRVADQPSDRGCPLRDAVRLRGQSAALAPSAPMVTCPLAVAWLMFERHSLQPAARAQFGEPVARVRHLGSYACRNVYGRAQGRRSRHATADALDIAAFTLAGGREIALPGDWGHGPPGAFLRALRDGACRWFSAVLGPEHNAAHRDHFHLERGSWRRCA